MSMFRSLGFGGIPWLLAVICSSYIAFGELSRWATWDSVAIQITDSGDPTAKRDALLTLEWVLRDGQPAYLEATRRELGRGFRHVVEGETLDVLSNPAQFGDLRTQMLFGTLYLFLGIAFFGTWRLMPFEPRSILGRTEIDIFDPNRLSERQRKRGLAQLSLKLVVLGIYGIGFSILGDDHRAGKAATYLPGDARVVSIDQQCKLEWKTGFYPLRKTETSQAMDCDIANEQAEKSDASVLADHAYILSYAHPKQGFQTKKVFQTFMRDEEPTKGEVLRVMMHPHRGQSIDNFDRINGGRSWGFILGCAIWSAIFALIAYLSWPNGSRSVQKPNRTRRKISKSRPLRSPQQPHPW